MVSLVDSRICGRFWVGVDEVEAEDEDPGYFTVFEELESVECWKIQDLILKGRGVNRPNKKASKKKGKKGALQRHHACVDPHKTELQLQRLLPFNPLSRVRIPAEANFTITRTVAEEHPCCWADTSIPSLELREMKDRIVDHANRRLQLFYYQMVAYFEEGCEVARARTDYQHGSAQCRSCQAAHSGILPNLEDDFFDRLKDSLYNRHNVTDAMKQKLAALGITDDNIRTLAREGLTNGNFSRIFRNFRRDSLICEQSQFYHQMNSTVTVFKDVNEYDSVIEEAFRPVAIQILNAVSQGTVNPYDGLKDFQSQLCEFLEEEKEACFREYIALEGVEGAESALAALECKQTIIVCQLEGSKLLKAKLLTPSSLWEQKLELIRREYQISYVPYEPDVAI